MMSSLETSRLAIFSWATTREQNKDAKRIASKPLHDHPQCNMYNHKMLQPSNVQYMVKSSSSSIIKQYFNKLFSDKRHITAFSAEENSTNTIDTTTAHEIQQATVFPKPKREPKSTANVAISTTVPVPTKLSTTMTPISSNRKRNLTTKKTTATIQYQLKEGKTQSTTVVVMLER